MTTRVAIHQPNYLPYLGFFHKMSIVDTFVLYDTAQFSKNDFHNRNRIKTPTGSGWLTVPVRRPGFRAIRDVEVDVKEKWAARHWKTIEANYSRADYFESYRTDLSSAFAQDWNRLSLLNEALIRLIAKAWGLSPRLVRASDCRAVGGASASSRLSNLVREVGGDTYVSGIGGLDYVDPGEFVDARLLVQDFRHPEYRQLWGAFLPLLSALDLLLNEGDRGRQILVAAGGVRPWPA